MRELKRIVTEKVLLDQDTYLQRHTNIGEGIEFRTKTFYRLGYSESGSYIYVITDDAAYVIHIRELAEALIRGEA